MKINQIVLFLSILIFGIIVNIFVYYDIQIFFLRAIVSYLFIITVPGLLIMLIFKIRKISALEYSVYTIGLSIFFIMVAGLAINWSTNLMDTGYWKALININGENLSSNEGNIEEIELPIEVDNIWIGKDDITYGYVHKSIVKSKDKGETWTVLYSFTEEVLGGGRVWVDKNGTIFAGRDNTGEMLESRDGGVTWKTSLIFVCQNKPIVTGGREGYGTMWSLDQDNEGNIYVGEYGGEWDASCAYIHKSTDGGKTWEISYNSADYGLPGRHIHALKVDPKTDYVYATQGDGETRAKLIRSTDHGTTWLTLQSGDVDMQYTTILMLGDTRLFGTDSQKPNRIVKTSDDLTFYTAVQFPRKGNHFVWSSSKDDFDVAFFGTVSEIAGNTVSLYETVDKGISWRKVKDIGLTTDVFQGINNISNFSSENYAYYHDGVNHKTYRFKSISDTRNNLESPITGKPLNTNRILISVDIFLLTLLIISSIRNRSFTLEIKLPRLNWLSIVLLGISLLFPTLAVIGANMLNNGGSGIVSIINYVIIYELVFMIFLFRRKLNTNIHPFIIFMISISLLLSGWLRSSYISGVDINHEYQVFQMTKTAQAWIPSSYINVYNSCLSLNILPTILSNLLSINDRYIFKLFIPLLFSITPVIIYCISLKYINKNLSFLAAFFFMSQPAFTTWTLIPIRQEIAFIFFALSILILLCKCIDDKRKLILFAIFSISMIVSHYSTAYIALVIFTLIYFIHKLSNLIYRKAITKSISYIPSYFGVTLILLIAFTYFWYAYLTYGLGYLVEFVNYSGQNINNILSSKVQAQGQTLFDQINIFKSSNINNGIFSNYVYEISEIYHKNNPKSVFYENSINSRYDLELKDTSGLPYFINQSVNHYFVLLRNLFKLLGVSTILIGTIQALRIKTFRKGVSLYLNAASFIIFLILVVTPFISINYDLLRIYQQILIILSFAAILGLVKMLNFFNSKYLINIASIFLIIYMIFVSRFIHQFLGGNDVSMIFNNTGIGYSMYYTHTKEIVSAQWLAKRFSDGNVVFADLFASTKLRLSEMSKYQNFVYTEVFPSTIHKNSYVYLNNPNTVDGVGFISYKGLTVSYSYPNAFLNENKNQIYNNGGSTIYK